MRAFLLAAMTVGALASGDRARAQEAVSLPLVQGMEFDDTCGPHPELQGRAICVQGALASISTAADAYIAHYVAQGWEVVAGEANGVVLARRREGGGCDGLEMAAFYDQTRPVGPGTRGWLAFAPIPGDLCPGAAAQ
jgi:hypothetical protein